MKNISKPSLLNLQLPLPSLAAQQQIVAEVNKKSAEAARLRQQADAVAAESLARVEAMVLGTI